MIPGNPAVPAARLPMNFPGDRGFEGAYRPDGSRTGPIGAVRFITLAGGGPAGEDHLSQLWISGSLARVSPLWLSADLPPSGDRVLVRVHPGRDRDRRADAPGVPPMTPRTAADGSDQDRAGDVARAQGDGSRGERNSAIGGETGGRPDRGCPPGNRAIPAPPRLDARKPNNRCARMEGFTALMSGSAGAIKRGNEGAWDCARHAEKT